MDSETTGDICVDCRERLANLRIRNRRLCSPCFMRYVRSKVLKRMESYRFKNLADDQKRRLFLPVSGGVSSLVLLEVLDGQLQKQLANRNRTAYDLVIARVALPDGRDPVKTNAGYEKLAQRFPMPVFLPILALHEVFRLDSKIEQDLGYLGVSRQDGESDVSLLGQVLASATSVTARADLQSILLHRLLVATAKQEKCESILWGHSDSRLAALALADVAKGRGGSVPSTIADGPSPHGLNFNYPVRDLFKSELEAYAQATYNPAFEGVGNISRPNQLASAIRNTSIDDLLNNYISSQAEKYPSIMANVVRTASKLEVKDASNVARLCPVCVMPVSGSPGLLNEDSILCYGCERMKKDIKLHSSTD